VAKYRVLISVVPGARGLGMPCPLQRRRPVDVAWAHGTFRQTPRESHDQVCWALMMRLASPVSVAAEEHRVRNARPGPLLRMGGRGRVCRPLGMRFSETGFMNTVA
jgi:hypothetical protein